MKEAINLYKLKSEIIFGLYVEIEEKYERELFDILNSECDSESKEEYKRVIQRITNVLRENAVVSLCSLLELMLKCVHDDPSMTIRKGIDRMRGGQIEQSLDTLIDIWNIRNCIVHDSGKVKGSKNEPNIRKIVKDIQDRHKENNFDLIGIYGDGYLCLGSDIVSHLLVVTQELIEAM